MLVKSMLVPLVDATAVPLVSGCESIVGVTTAELAVVIIVPVFAGSVNVFVPDMAGADIVIAPDVSPETTIELIEPPIYCP
jgi:hypothetical protein